MTKPTAKTSSDDRTKLAADVNEAADYYQSALEELQSARVRWEEAAQRFEEARRGGDSLREHNEQ